MGRRETARWESLEQWSPAAFLAGAAMFAGSAAITVYDIVAGAEQLRMMLGQAFVGAGWIGGLLGLVGLYPKLAARSRWAARVGGLVTVVGLVGYGLMTATELLAFVGVIAQPAVDGLAPVFLPLVAIGTVLAFPIMGMTSLRNGAHSRRTGGLLILPTLVFIANVATPTPAEVVLVVLIALTGVYAAIGAVLRREVGRQDEHAVPPADPTAN